MSRVRRTVVAVAVSALALTGAIAIVANPLADVPAAQAADPLAPPEVFKLQGAADRIGDVIDELRIDFVVKVPHGYVNPATGAMQTVGGNQLRVGYDYGNGGVRNMGYLNTMGAAGATAWANNRNEYFTIHNVIVSGESDFLVMSLEGDLNFPDNAIANNVPGGKPGFLNLYLSYATGNVPGSGGTTAWIPTAKTVHPFDYNEYYDRLGATNVAGPQIGMQFDGIYNLWSGDQANWGQVLDFGLNNYPAGVLPPNSVAVDLANRAYSSVAAGPAGSVSDSFWYAWVHEDGSLVTDINTAPIHVTGVTPSSSRNGTSNVVKNLPSTSPTLAYTAAQGAQGLTTKVGADGAIDFTTAGGTGYYRLAVWPESRNPTSVTADNGAPLLSYTAADLFDANGLITASADNIKWLVGSAYYKYNVPLPPAPVIDTPVTGSRTNHNTSVVISGRGEPDHTITLKWKSGTATTDFNDPNQTLLVDGQNGTEVTVQPDGTWTYTYTPASPIADGTYSIVAAQTEHSTGYEVTSPPSNPNNATTPTAWGVTFTIDTVAPTAPAFACPASPTSNPTPSFSGTGVESGAVVEVFQNNVKIGEATVTGASWTYTIDTALVNGTYNFTVKQRDIAGNLSAASAPVCTLQIAADVPVSGTKVVTDVHNGDPSLPAVSPSNWEITATTGGTTSVISGSSNFKFVRGTSYTIGERLRSTPTPEANAPLYTQRGQLVCTDANGGALPAGIVNAANQTVLIPSAAAFPEPMRCEMTNSTSQATFVTQRLGGQTTDPAADWTLNAVHSSTQYNFALDSAVSTRVARPADYSLTADAPDGLAIIGLQHLDLSVPACAALANTAATAPESCWVQVAGGATASGVALPQGQHSVFRIVAASPADMPSIPLTGGLGSWIFTVGGLGALAIAGLAYFRRHRLQLAAASRITEVSAE
ncbi:Ig-like domain-containing protein [Leucobacter sp. NPDC058333]|uniref:Ig-like domain-containing protein n=1 Tax=Leucobacter sp. NPDC058333 TaxID=3346450 RepID=UPI0036587262